MSAANTEDWKELQQKLSDAFTTDGIIGKRVGHILDAEARYGEFVETNFRGVGLLSHAFQEFYMDTIELAAAGWEEQGRDPTPATYTEVWLWHLANFRSVRAVDILFHNGYPMDGLTRLRHLKESALLLGGMLSGLTNYTKLKAWETPDGQQTAAPTDQRRRREIMAEERRVLGLMIRAESGIPSDDLDELRIWESFFNMEVHGALLTQVLEHGPTVLGRDTMSVAPKPRNDSIGMFMNRMCEVAWMLHRTLPILQLSDRRFDSSWEQKWTLLDENFLAMEQSLADLGKEIGNVLIRFIEEKLPFDHQACFDTHVRA
ncbi:hypothetical protein [Haloferula sp. A504]|uniref:hypothetical protein n=1 Tax=Haloferula sp. A504 TaxID=3373601 RepID=UPI0031BC80D0|nr:hypothetical protein [Verrucomicrobiaceae bacterium E54]